jgi:hypothetical protein
VGQELGGAIAAALLGTLGLILAVLRLSVTGLLTALAVLAVAAALWRWTIHDVQQWIALKGELARAEERKRLLGRAGEVPFER